MAFAIVQAAANSANNTDGSSAIMHLASPPINGNLLIAVVMSWLSGSDLGANLNAGWVLHSTVNSGVTAMRIACLYKYCMAGESATQQPSANGNTLWAQLMWEMSGVAPVITDVIKSVHLNANLGGFGPGPMNTTPFDTIANDVIVLGGFTGNQGSPTFLTSSTGVLDAQVSNNKGSGACSATAVHYGPVGGGVTIQSTITLTNSSSVESGFVELVGTAPPPPLSARNRLILLGVGSG